MAQPEKTVAALARVALLSTLFFVFVMYVAFVFIQPHLNPLYRYGSEYAVGRMGWLMKLAFFVWGGGILALALAMAKGLDVESRSPTAVVFFVVGGLGIFVAGVSDADLQLLNENPPPVWVEGPPSDEQLLHAAASLVGLLSLMIAAGFATRRLRLAGRLGPGYRVLRILSWLTPAAFLAFAGSTGYGVAGLGQRVFLALVFAWQLIAARGLAAGAFSVRS